MGISKGLAAACVILLVAGTSASAQFSEPAAFEAMHPDRDVLNGGALTPEAQMRTRGLINAVPEFSNAHAGPVPVVPHLRHLQHHRR